MDIEKKESFGASSKTFFVHFLLLKKSFQVDEKHQHEPVASSLPFLCPISTVSSSFPFEELRVSKPGKFVATVRKSVFTLSPDFALVSVNITPNSPALSSPSCAVTCLCYCKFVCHLWDRLRPNNTRRGARAKLQPARP